MNWLDIVIVIYLVISIVGGLTQGLIRSALSLVGLIVGIVVASHYYQQFGKILAFIPNQDAANIIAFIIILGAVVAIASLIGVMLRSLIKAIMLGWVDRAAGAVFGLFMGGLTVAAILAVIMKLAPTNIIVESRLAGFFLEKFPVVLSFLPSEFDVISNFFK